MLALATVAMKATGTYSEGVLSASSGYLWTSIIYNVSICWSLYDLALFWVCMSTDLQPFRPMPKFLCIKGIIFASWWQGFFLSILVALGAIPSIGGGYTADNLAAAIQDALICFEMPFFALSHWYAFSWKDYADETISDARMPIRFALRDTFGPRDLIEDAKETWSGKKYEYRYFDAEDNVIAHEESSSRTARMQEGMRYERGGRGKYWIPSPGTEGAKQPLLSRVGDSHARTMSPGGSKSRSSSKATKNYGIGPIDELGEPELDPQEEKLYVKARELEFGDWNYPVINTHYATRDDRLRTNPNMISATTNRAILQPTKDNKARRKSRIKAIQDDVHQQDSPSSSSSNHRGSSSSGSTSAVSKGKQRLQAVTPLVRNPSATSSHHSAHSQLVDLVVEDREAEEIERVRARKEGGPGWNSVEQKHFVKTFPGEDEQEEVRRGFNPDRPEEAVTDESHTLVTPRDGFEGVDKEAKTDETGAKQPWQDRGFGDVKAAGEEGRNPWSD